MSSYAPVPVSATLDGVDMKFDVCVVMDILPPGICLGPQGLKCYNINRQEPTGEARIAERALFVVSFVIPEAAPIPLRGLADTGSGVSILTFSAFNKIEVKTGAVLRPYRVELYDANGKTIGTYGMVERVRCLLSGNRTNFLVVDDAMGVKSIKSMWNHTHSHVGDSDSAQKVV